MPSGAGNDRKWMRPVNVCLIGCRNRQPVPCTQPDNATSAAKNHDLDIFISKRRRAAHGAVSVLPQQRRLLAHRTDAIHAGQKQWSARVQRTWLQQYQAGVPTDIDRSEYASLRDLFEEPVATHKNKPVYSNMGTNLTF